MQFQPVIRWTGGKRKQSEEIIGLFPKEIDTLWIPFLGGGSVMYQAINSNVKIRRIMCSDIYAPLMVLWNLIQNSPKQLMVEYTAHWDKLELDRGYYKECVDKFNADGGVDAILFFFLSRCCTRGSITYDNNGNFISKMSEKDLAIRPNMLSPIVQKWSEAVRDVEFECASYEDIVVEEMNENDFIFLDPPYIDGTLYKDHNMDWESFWNWIRSIPCDYSMTLNGDKDIYPIPTDLYTDHKYIYYGVTTTSMGSKSGNRDSLWMRKIKGNYDPDHNNIRQNSRLGGGAANTTSNETIAFFELNDKVAKMEDTIGNIESNMEKILSLLGGAK